MPCLRIIRLQEVRKREQGETKLAATPPADRLTPNCLLTPPVPSIT